MTTGLSSNGVKSTKLKTYVKKKKCKMFKVPIKKGRKEEENVAFFDLDFFAVF
jgi:hypothetical protein